MAPAPSNGKSTAKSGFSIVPEGSREHERALENGLARDDAKMENEDLAPAAKTLTGEKQSLQRKPVAMTFMNPASAGAYGRADHLQYDRNMHMHNEEIKTGEVTMGGQTVSREFH